MLLTLEQVMPDDQEWQQSCQMLSKSASLSAVVLTAWRMGLWFAKAIVEQQLMERAQAPTQWAACSVCGAALRSKGFAKRQILTLVGVVEWKRRVGRCPHHCLGSQRIPFDETLEIEAH